MLGDHLDGVHIKEADKVPRRSLTFGKPPQKRARLEEPAAAIVSCNSTNLQTDETPPAISAIVQSDTNAVGDDTKDSTSPPIALPIPLHHIDPVSLIKAGKWTEFTELVDRGVKMQGHVIHALVQAGKIDLLIYARSLGNCKFKTKNVIKYAVKRNLPQKILDDLEKLRGNVAPPATVPLCVPSEHNNNFSFDLGHLSLEKGVANWCRALERDPLHILADLRQSNCPWDCTVCEKAVRLGHYEALQFLLKEGCPMGTKLYKLIIERELWKFLPLIVQYGYKLDPKIRFEFARYGQVEGLKAAHECGLKMVSEVCVLAALNGHLDCLTFAHEHGAKIDQKVCLGAVQQGHLSCLRYALQHGCTMTKVLPTQAVKYKHMHILKYLHEQGCPMDKKTSKMAEDLPVPPAVELDINT